MCICTCRLSHLGYWWYWNKVWQMPLRAHFKHLAIPMHKSPFICTVIMRGPHIQCGDRRCPRIPTDSLQHLQHNRFFFSFLKKICSAWKKKTGKTTGHNKLHRRAMIWSCRNHRSTELRHWEFKMFNNKKRACIQRWHSKQFKWHNKAVCN